MATVGRSPKGTNAYRRFFAVPEVLATAIAATVSALPSGMGAVALVLYTQHVTGSFTSAGVVTAAFTIGLGLTAPLLARLIDRVGTQRILIPAAVCESVALVLLVILGNAGADTTTLALTAAAAGAAAPPIGGVMRRRWPELVPAEDIPTAYAVDAIQIEVIFIAGPLLAGLLAAAVGPGPGLLIAAGIATIGSVWFASLVGNGEARPERDPSHGWAGPLSSPTVRLLALTGIPLGATFGVLDVSLPAFGAAHGAPAIGGPLAAALAAGSAASGILYGAHPDRFGSAPRTFVILSFVQTLTCLPLLLASTIPMMFGLAALAGVCVAPVVTARNQIVQESAPAGTAVEAFTWMGLSLTIGASGGSAVAGPLVAAGSWRTGVALACACPLVAWLLALSGRRQLRPLRSGIVAESAEGGA
jgi:MFS family permease